MALDHEQQREEEEVEEQEEPPKDFFNLAYLSFFLLGAGFLLPWNAFITAVDYFDLLYPNTHIDRVFSASYMLPSMALLLYLTFRAGEFKPQIRINLGLLLFLLMMLLIPILDELRASASTHFITIAAVSITGIADALVQGSLVGSAGELPECFMQALVAGTAASGVLVSGLRIVTKAALPSTPDGLRRSSNVYFITSVIFMLICILVYNMLTSLPVIRYHLKKKKNTAATKLLLLLPDDEQGDDSRARGGGVNYARVWKQSRGLMLSLSLIYVITLAIFPGSLTEDVHSQSLGDWYPILLIACYNVTDLIGKSLTAICLLQNTSALISASLARLIFFPLFWLCLHGPGILRTELPVFFITALLGISNGYLTSAIMITAPKLVPVEDAETTGIMLVVFLVTGLALGSITTWLWVL